MARQIEVGKNTDLTLEVLAFVTSGSLLKKVGQISTEYIVVSDIKAAENFAWNTFYGAEELTWSDFRSARVSEIWEIIFSDYEKYAQVEAQLESIQDELSYLITNQLDEIHKELLDDIVSDLKGCLYSRAILGLDGCFFESIFNVYLNGGWPCGYEGEDIKLLTYFKERYSG